MFIFMADDTQAPRDANAPGALGGAARGLRTWRRLVGTALAAALIGAASAAAWKASRTTTGHQWYAVGMLVLSETLIDAGLGPRRPKEIRHADGSAETVTLGAIAGHRPLLALRERMIDELLDAALIGLAIGVGIAVAVLAALHYARGRLKRGRRLRGGEPVSARQLGRRVTPPRIRLQQRFGRPAGRPYRIAGILLKLPGAWPVARIGLRYRKRPKVAERFAPRVEERASISQVDMPEDGWAERPGEAKGAIEQASEAEAAVDLWELDPPPPGNGNPDSASRPGPAPPTVEPGAGPDDDGRPPGATADRANMRGRKSSDGARLEGGMIRI